jgi:hypothetical protein
LRVARSKQLSPGPADRALYEGEALMSFAIRMLVTLSIVIPYWLIRMPTNTAEIFVLAVVAFGAGRIVAYLIDKKPTAS